MGLKREILNMLSFRSFLCHTLEAPTNLVTSEVTQSSFRATWTPPNGTVEKYDVTYMMTAGERIEKVRLNSPPHVSLKQEYESF